MIGRNNLSPSYILVILLLSCAKSHTLKQQQDGNIHLETSETNKTDGSSSSPNQDDAAIPQLSCGLPLYRLPSRIQPQHYELLIAPDFSSQTFEGAIQISVLVGANNSANLSQTADRVLAPNQIILHASRQLNIEHVRYLDQSRAATGSAPPKAADLYKFNSTLSQVDFRASFNSSGRSGGGGGGDSYTDQPIELQDVCRELDYDLIVVTLARDLKPNSTGLLQFLFNGNMSSGTNQSGLYLSPWTRSPAAAKNESAPLIMGGFNAVTQFEATHAREVFPCFDEPAMKATFELSLIYPSNKTALSNTLPVYLHTFKPPTIGDGGGGGGNSTVGDEDDASKSTAELLEPPDDEYSLVKFARTPPMSTYLLAFTVGDYEFLEDHLQLRGRRKLRVRVYTPPGGTPMAQLVLQTATRAMRVLARLLDDAEYPLQKIDLVGVDMTGAGMENWGLITLKQLNALRVDPQHTPLEQRAYVASVVVHELAHQWFGNLVTMRWWNDVWLNEGFATWMEQRVLAEIYPDLAHYKLFDSQLAALECEPRNGVESVRPRVAVLQRKQIDELFSCASYCQGASIIQMLETSWKWQGFMPAINTYIRRNKFGPADLGDLLASLGADTSLPGAMLKSWSSWLNEPGYPKLEVHLAPDGSRLHYRQERFLRNAPQPNNATDTREGPVWPIPVKGTLFAETGDKTVYYLLDQRNGSIELPTTLRTPASGSGRPAKSWIKLNKDFDGYYVVHYSDEMFASLSGAAELARMSVADRINLLEETVILFKARQTSCARVLVLIWELARQEKAPQHGAVLRSMLRAYETLASFFSATQTSVGRALAQFGQRTFGDILFKQFPKEILSTKSGGGDFSSYWDAIGRASLFERLVGLDYKPAVSRALQLFDETSSSRRSGSVQVHLRPPLYLAVARRGTEQQFGRLISMCRDSDSLEHRMQLMVGMSQSQNRTRLVLVWRLLMSFAEDDPLTTEQPVETKLEPLIAMAGADNPAGRRFVLDLLAHNFTEILELNEEESITSLLEELYLSSTAEEVARLSELLVRLQANPSAADWPASLEDVLQTIEWRSSLRDHSYRPMELALRKISATFGSSSSPASIMDLLGAAAATPTSKPQPPTTAEG